MMQNWHSVARPEVMRLVLLLVLLLLGASCEGSIGIVVHSRAEEAMDESPQLECQRLTRR